MEKYVCMATKAGKAPDQPKVQISTKISHNETMLGFFLTEIFWRYYCGYQEYRTHPKWFDFIEMVHRSNPQARLYIFYNEDAENHSSHSCFVINKKEKLNSKETDSLFKNGIFEECVKIRNEYNFLKNTKEN